MENFMGSIRKLRSKKYVVRLAVALVVMIAAVSILAGTLLASAAEGTPPSITASINGAPGGYVNETTAGGVTLTAGYTPTAGTGDYIVNPVWSSVVYTWTINGHTETGNSVTLDPSWLNEGSNTVALTSTVTYSYDTITEVVDGNGDPTGETTTTTNDIPLSANATATIYYDKTAPVVSAPVISTTGGVGINGSVEFTVADATDSGAGINAGGYSYTINGVPATRSGNVVSVSASALSLTANADNTFVCTMTATDNAGNTSTVSSASATLYYDTTPPAFGAVSYSGAAATHTAGGKEYAKPNASGAYAVTFAATGAETLTGTVAGTDIGTVNFNGGTATVNVTGYTGAALTYSVTAADEYGNTASDAGTLAYFDAEAPEVGIAVDVAYVRAGDTAVATITDVSTGESCPIDWTNCALTAVSGVTVVNNLDGTFNLTLESPTSLSDETALITGFTAVDHLGNSRTYNATQLADNVQYLDPNYSVSVSTANNPLIAGGTESLTVTTGHSARITSLSYKINGTGAATGISFTPNNYQETAVVGFTAPSDTGKYIVITVETQDELGGSRTASHSVYIGDFDVSLGDETASSTYEKTATQVYLRKNATVSFAVESNRTLVSGTATIGGKTYDIISGSFTVPYLDYLALNSGDDVALSVTDDLGNSTNATDSVDKSFRIDNALPGGSGTDRSAGFVGLSGSGTASYTMTITATDADSGVQSVVLNGPAPGSTITAVKQTGTDNYVATVTTNSTSGSVNITATIVDNVGNEYQTDPFGTPTVLPALSVNTVSVRSTNGKSASDLTNADELIISFTTNNDVDVTALTVNGSAAACSYDSTANTITVAATGIAGKTPGQKLTFSFTVEDEAGATKTVSATTDSSSVTYRAPLSIGLVFSNTSNAHNNYLSVVDADDTDSVSVTVPKGNNDLSAADSTITFYDSAKAQSAAKTFTGAAIGMSAEIAAADMTGFAEGKIYAVFTARDIYGQSCTTYAMTAKAYETVAFLDNAAPVFTAANVTLEKNGTVVDGTGFVRNGDVVTVTAVITDTAGEGLDSVTINGVAANVTGTAGTYTAVADYTVAKADQTDSAMLEITVVATDRANAVTTVVEDDAPTYYDGIAYTAQPAFAMTDGDAYAMNGDGFTLSFKTNHPTTITSLTVAGEAYTPTAAADGMNYSIALALPATSNIDDMDNIVWSMALADAAGNTMTDNANGTGVVYYAPFDIELSFENTDGADYLGLQYLNAGDVFTVGFQQALASDGTETDHDTRTTVFTLGGTAFTLAEGANGAYSASGTVSATSPTAEGRLQYTYAITDMAGNIAQITTAADSPYYLDRVDPAFVSSSLELKRAGAADFAAIDTTTKVKAGDTIRLTFTLDDVGGFVEPYSISIDGQDYVPVTGTPAGTQATYSVVLPTLTAGQYTDEGQIEWTLTGLDTAGNSFTKNDVAGPEFYEDILYTATPVFEMDDKNASDDRGDYAKNGDGFNISFTTNHPTAITSLIVAGEDYTTDALAIAPAGTTVYSLDLDLPAATLGIGDEQNIEWSIELADDALNTRDDDYDSGVVYYEPFTINMAAADAFRNTGGVSYGTPALQYLNAGDSFIVRFRQELVSGDAYNDHDMRSTEFVLGGVSFTPIEATNGSYYQVNQNVSTLAAAADGILDYTYRIEDKAGNVAQITTAVDSPYYLDRVNPVYVSRTLKLQRSGTTGFSDITTATTVKAGDTIRLGFTLEDVGGFKEPYSISIDGRSDTPTRESAVGNQVTYYVDLPLTRNQYADEHAIKWTLSGLDIAGNSFTESNIEGPVFYRDITITNFTITDNGYNYADDADKSVANDGLVRDGDRATVTFTANHPLTDASIQSLSFNGKSAAYQSHTEVPSGSNYNYTVIERINDGVVNDLHSIPWTITLADAADNATVTINQSSTGSRIRSLRRLTYYAPIVVGDLEYITSNRTENEGNKYAKVGDTVTVNFSTNHPIGAYGLDGTDSTVMLRHNATASNDTLIPDYTSGFRGAIPTTLTGDDIKCYYTAVFDIDNDGVYTDIDGLLNRVITLYDAGCNTYASDESTAITKDTTAPLLKSNAGTGETLGVDFSVTKTTGAVMTITDTVRKGDTLTVDFFTTDNFSIRTDTVKVKMVRRNNDNSVYLENALTGGTPGASAAYVNGGTAWSTSFIVPTNYNESDMSKFKFFFEFEDLAGNKYNTVIDNTQQPPTELSGKSFEAGIIYYKSIMNSFSTRQLRTNNATTNTACRAGDTVTITMVTTHPVTMSDFTFYYNNTAKTADAITPSNETPGRGYQRFTCTVTVDDTLDDLTLISYSAKFNDVVANDEFIQPFFTAQNNYSRVWYYRPLGNDAAAGEIAVSDPPVITSSNARNSSMYAKNDDWLYVDIKADHEVRVVAADSSICDHTIIPSLTGAGNAKYSGTYNQNVRMSRICVNNETIDQTPIYCTFTVMDPAGHTFTHGCTGKETLIEYGSSGTADSAFANANGYIIYYAPITVYTGISSTPEAPYYLFARNGCKIYLDYFTNHLTAVQDAQIMRHDVDVEYICMYKEPYKAYYETMHHISYYEQEYEEGKVSYMLSLDDVAGNLYMQTRNEADDPNRPNVYYDRSTADISVVPKLEGDGSTASILVIVDDLTKRLKTSQIKVTNKETNDVVTYSDGLDGDKLMGTRQNTINFNSSGTYEIVVTSNDNARNPPVVHSFEVEVDMKEGGGYNVDIVSSPNSYVQQRSKLRDLVYINQGPDRVKSVTCKVDGKETDIESLLYGLAVRKVEFGAITKNDKEINFTISMIETVHDIGEYNDVIGNDVFSWEK